MEPEQPNNNANAWRGIIYRGPAIHRPFSINKSENMQSSAPKMIVMKNLDGSILRGSTSFHKEKKKQEKQKRDKFKAYRPKTRSLTRQENDRLQNQRRMRERSRQKKLEKQRLQKIIKKLVQREDRQRQAKKREQQRLKREKLPATWIMSEMSQDQIQTPKTSIFMDGQFVARVTKNQAAKSATNLIIANKFGSIIFLEPINLSRLVNKNLRQFVQLRKDKIAVKEPELRNKKCTVVIHCIHKKNILGRLSQRPKEFELSYENEKAYFKNCKF